MHPSNLKLSIEWHTWHFDDQVLQMVGRLTQYGKDEPYNAAFVNDEGEWEDVWLDGHDERHFEDAKDRLWEQMRNYYQDGHLSWPPLDGD